MGLVGLQVKKKDHQLSLQICKSNNIPANYHPCLVEVSMDIKNCEFSEYFEFHQLLVKDEHKVSLP